MYGISVIGLDNQDRLGLIELLNTRMAQYANINVVLSFIYIFILLITIVISYFTGYLVIAISQIDLLSIMTSFVLFILIFGLMLGFLHVRFIIGRETTVETESLYWFISSTIFLFSTILGYNILENLEIIPKNILLNLLDDIAIPWLYSSFAHIIFVMIFLLGDKVKVKSIHERLLGMYSLLIITVPLVLGISFLTVFGIKFRYGMFFIWGDTILAEIGIIIAFTFFIKVYSYVLPPTYLNTADIFVLLTGNFIAFNIADIIENFVTDIRAIFLFDFIQILSLILMWLTFIMICINSVHLYRVITGIAIMRKKQKINIPLGTPVVLEIDFSNPMSAYFRSYVYLREFVQHLITSSKSVNGKIPLVYVTKPNSLLLVYIQKFMSNVFRRYIAILAPEKMRDEKISEGKDEVVYLIPPSSIHIMYFLRSVIEKNKGKPVFLVFDNLSDFAVLSGIRETYITLRNLMSLGDSVYCFLLLPKGSLRQSDRNLILSIIPRRVEL